MATAVLEAVTERRPVNPLGLPHRGTIYMLCFWCGWVGLKVGNIQVVEGFMLLHAAYLASNFLLGGGNTSYSGLWIRPGRWYGWIMLGIAMMTLASLRLQKFPPRYGPIFATNPIAAIVGRFTELGLVVFYSMYAAELMRRDPRLRYYGMRMYAFSAVCSAWYTLASVPFTNYNLFGSYEEYRGRGGFTEGGPWGLYLVTAVLVGRILWLRKQMTRKEAIVFTVSIVYAFIAARSRASAFAGLAVLLISVFLGSSLQRKLASLAGLAVIFAAAWYAFDLSTVYDNLIKLRDEAEILVTLDPYNLSTAYGRIAGSVIVPRMLADHWFTGIGWGNYPLLRNNPKYLGLMHPVLGYDLPGLGLAADAAELGIPGLVALYVILFYPAILSRRTRTNSAVTRLALTAPVIFLMGAQLTLFYPWLISAFALSFLPLQHGSVRLTKVSPAPQPALTGLRATA